MAILLFVSGVATVYPLLNTTQQANHALWQRYRAGRVASQELQRLIQEDLKAGRMEYETVHDGLHYKVLVYVRPNEARLKEVSLRVHYPVQGESAEIILGTVLYEAL